MSETKKPPARLARCLLAGSLPKRSLPLGAVRPLDHWDSAVCPCGHCLPCIAHRELRSYRTELTYALRPSAMPEQYAASTTWLWLKRGSTFETEPRSAANFDDRIGDTRFPLLVAESAKEVIGWAGVSSYSSRSCYVGIGECSVYVATAARGRGVGTSMTEALARAAYASGFHKLIGKLFADNTASVRLVERCGFSSVGLHRRHGRLDGIWRDVLVVERLLDGPADAGAFCR